MIHRHLFVKSQRDSKEGKEDGFQAFMEPKFFIPRKFLAKKSPSCSNGPDRPIHAVLKQVEGSWYR